MEFSNRDLYTLAYTLTFVSITYYLSHRYGAARKDWPEIAMIATQLISSIVPLRVTEDELTIVVIVSKGVSILASAVLLYLTYRKYGLALFSRRAGRVYYMRRSRYRNSLVEDERDKR